MHVLKTIIDREAVKQILVNFGREPAPAAKTDAPKDASKVFGIDAVECYSNGTSAEMPSIEAFKRGLRAFLRGAQKADLEAAYGPEADALRREAREHVQFEGKLEVGTSSPAMTARARRLRTALTMRNTSTEISTLARTRSEAVIGAARNECGARPASPGSASGLGAATRVRPGPASTS